MTPSTENNFLSSWFEIEKEIHENARDKEFWNYRYPNGEVGYNPTLCNKGEKLALIHAEVSEVLEEIRLPEEVSSKKIPNFSTIEEELADVAIRLIDFAGAYDYDIAGAIVAKMEYNKTRPIKHGKKF